MNIKKMPIIGTVRTKELKYSTGDKTHVVPSETYSVVGIQDINGEKAYITDVWYKEYKQVPLIIIEGIVDEYIPQANVGYILLAEKLKNIAPKTFDAADEKIASRVRERRFDNGGLIAPNGKPSNLTAHQYEVVRTPEFKAWFGDWENDLANSSKVIDENGEPKVMYHGTTKDFSIFERTSGEFGGGIYFGSNYDANYFANVSAGHTPLSQQNIIPVFLNIRNPYTYRKATATKPMPTRSSLMKKGFDGVFGFTLNDTLEVVAYDSNQIKSALSNMTFDSANPDIRFDNGGPTKKKLKATGDCYVVALEFTMGFLSPYKGKYVGTPYIVHGEVQGQGQISNIRYGHAWVEDDANVYDFSNNRQMIVPKMIYYMIGNINPDDPKKYRKYTFTEARRKSIETGIYGPWEIETEYRDGGQLSPDDKKEIFKKWRSLVNMSKTELERFYNSEEGKEAGLSAGEAKSAGIDSGRESARWIMKMKDTPVSEWTPAMWKWAKKQISFISRMRGNKGSLYDDKGRKTRKHTSLLIWGHNPKK